MKIVIYAVVQVLIRLAPRNVQLVMVFAICGIITIYTLLWLAQGLQHLTQKIRSFLELRRACQKLAEIDRRLAKDARLAPTLDPYRQGKTSSYQKEIDQIVVPLSVEQRRALLHHKKLSAALKEALQKSPNHPTE